MWSLLRHGLQQMCKITPQAVSSFHIMTFKSPILPATSFLLPKLQTIVQTCGLKIKGRVKRRCRDCYFVMREQRLYVMCKTHPRHKQVTMAKNPKNTWILSHATQSKFRPW